MSAFSVCSLFSGSSGNATYLQAGNTRILVDCGVSAMALCRQLASLSVDPASLDAILITHEHIDHVKGLEVFSKRFAVPVYMTAPSADAMGTGSHLETCLHRFAPGDEWTVGEIAVRSFSVFHDSACCVGYRLEQGESAVAIATDIGSIQNSVIDAFLGAEAVILESNHDVDLLLANPHYPPALKARILSDHGHLSNELCARFLSYLARSGTRHALLAHMSKENNDRARILGALDAHLSPECGIAVQIAEEKSITPLIGM